jgi:hypothetical protein
MRILEIIREVKFLESGQGGTSEGFGFVNRRAGACAVPRMEIVLFNDAAWRKLQPYKALMELTLSVFA